VEYSTPFHPQDEMMWNTPHHSVDTEAAVTTPLECYVCSYKLEWHFNTFKF